MHKLFIATTLCFLFTLSQASELELIASTGNDGKYLPSISYLTNVSPQISHAGDITFFSQGFFTDTFSHGIFVKKADEKVGKVTRVLGDGEYISSLSLNNFGEILIATNDGAQSQDILKYNFIDERLTSVLRPDSDTFSMTSVMINDDSHLMYRLKKTNGLKSLVYKNTKTTRVLLEEGKDGISYIFSPVMKDHWLLVKVRYGAMGEFGESQPDRLWLFNLKRNTRHLVAADKDAMPSSKIKSIDNLYNLNSLGHTVFWAHTNTGRSLYLTDNEVTRVILNELDSFKAVDLFRPSLNDIGYVAIRGTNLDGIQVISVYDHDRWTQVVAQGDIGHDQTDSYKITKRRALTFIGAPMVNNLNEIVFNANTVIQRTGQRVEAIFKLSLKELK